MKKKIIKWQVRQENLKMNFLDYDSDDDAETYAKIPKNIEEISSNTINEKNKSETTHLLIIGAELSSDESPRHVFPSEITSTTSSNVEPSASAPLKRKLPSAASLLKSYVFSCNFFL